MTIGTTGYVRSHIEARIQASRDEKKDIKSVELSNESLIKDTDSEYPEDIRACN